MLVDLSLIQKYDISGPRYTSYPTALQFEESSDVDYRRAVHSRGDDPISLYTHLPFCNTLCYYCACSKIVTKDKTAAERYLGYLFKEIEAHARLYQDREVRQLHWGGGTPTYLTDDQINRLSVELRCQFDFADDGEYSIEIDPRTVDPACVANLRQAGFNRLSLGIQDVDPKVQKAVNRKQPFDLTEEVIQAARLNAFESVSVDLIYGLPFQNLRTIDTTLDQVISLQPDRISLYNSAKCLINIVSPVIRSDSGAARKSTSSAVSSGLGCRVSGGFGLPCSSFSSGKARHFLMPSVAVKPGATQLMLML